MKSTLFIISLLIAFSSVANAECAWVLWIRTDILLIEKDKLPIEKVQWELMGAVPQYEFCAKMLKSSYESQKRFWMEGRSPEKVKLNDEKCIIFPMDGMTIRFYCLPDTIDPRK